MWEGAFYLKLLAHATDMCGRKEVHRGSPLLSLAVIISYRARGRRTEGGRLTPRAQEQL